ncbi:MAG: hypothetical protein U0232_12695 [Thermomicrobiales bacterium]
MDRSIAAPNVNEAAPRHDSRVRLSRRALGRTAIALCIGAILGADGPIPRPGRQLPIAVDDDAARYLNALTDIPTPDWSLLAVTAAVLNPGNNTARGLLGQLPGSSLRSTALGWTYRAEAGRMRDLLAQAVRIYRQYLPPARASYYANQLENERARLGAGAQVDYSSVYHTVTLVNREQGLIARAEIDDLHLVKQHQLDPSAQPKDVATLLRERAERRALAADFRREAARLLGGAAQRSIAAPGGPLTLLGDLGETGGGAARTYQLVRNHLSDPDAATLAAEAVYFTAGEYLGLEPATPPDRWADLLPAEQRAYATANTLSPRLSPAAILDPAHASRILWAGLSECRTLVAELRAL